MRELRTQVAIVGAGPAGLLLGHLLGRAGIETMVFERRSRDYVERRVRAGVIEYGVANLLEESGAGARMREVGLVHHGVEIRFEGQSHRIPLTELSGGKSITVYGQQEVVKDLIGLRLASGAPLSFEATVTALEDLTSSQPSLLVRAADGETRVRCDFVAGCDGSFGVAHQSLPAGVLRRHERTYGSAWLGILAEAAPATEELVYCRHENGFALYSMRSPTLSRLYLGVRPDTNLDDWSDARIWDELTIRLASEERPELTRGPILERGITAMRSVVIESMRYGSLFLAGDAAHIVPPTGAKGMNLALADVRILAEALTASIEGRGDALLDAYTATCLERVWRAQEFSNYMTQMLHPSHDDEFENGVQSARLRQLVNSPEASTVFARNYVDLNGSQNG